MKMTLRAKIISGFVFVFATGMLLGITGLVSINMISRLSREQYLLRETNSSVSDVLNAHYGWRQDLTEAVLTGGQFKGSLDSQTCALGKWRDSEEAQGVDDFEILALLSQIDAPHSHIHSEAGDVVSLIQAGNLEQAKQLFLAEVLPETEQTISMLSAMGNRYTVLVEEKSQELVGLEAFLMMIIYILLALAVVVCVTFAILIIKSIMKPIRRLTKAFEAIATGDLEVTVTHPVNDEIGKLADSFQRMVEDTRNQVSILENLSNGDLTMEISPRGEKDTMGIALQKTLDRLNQMFGDISSASDQVSAGAKQIADGARSLAQGSTEQASAVEELSTVIAEVAEKMKTNSNMASEAAELAGVIKQNAEKGSEQMTGMMEAVKDINDASQSISKVIKVIDDIAFQTNILALNAAVEAARAGQYGKGFAVVAEEVRKLAAKSGEAAKDTGELIANSMEKAEYGSRIARKTANSLGKIVEGIEESTRIVKEIAKSSEEQATFVSQINTGIDQVAQVVQQNSATAEESAAASEEMSSQSDMLYERIAQFHLKANSHSRRSVHLLASPINSPQNGSPLADYSKY